MPEFQQNVLSHLPAQLSSVSNLPEIQQKQLHGLGLMKLPVHAFPCLQADLAPCQSLQPAVHHVPGWLAIAAHEQAAAEAELTAMMPSPVECCGSDLPADCYATMMEVVDCPCFAVRRQKEVLAW